MEVGSVEEMIISDPPRQPPRVDRYAEFLRKGQTGGAPGGGVPEPTQRATVSMDEGIIPELIQREFPCYAIGCGDTFKSKKECETHYNGKHRYVCSICKKTFYSSHLLELHVTETHDAFFAVAAMRKPMYECYLEVCKQKFHNEEERYTHCAEEHKDKKPFFFFPRSKSLNQSSTTKSESMEMVVDFEPDRVNKPNEDLQSQKKNTKSQSQSIKKQNIQISFGQKAVKFIPRQTFALSKKKPTKNDSTEEKMDLTDMKDVLSEFSMDSAEAVQTENTVSDTSVQDNPDLIDKASMAANSSLVPVPVSSGSGLPVSESQLEVEASSEHDALSKKRVWIGDGHVEDPKKLKIN